MTSSLDLNKQSAMAIYGLMFNQCKPAEAVAKFVGQTYTQHNRHVTDGTTAFIEYVERMAREYLSKQVHF